MEKNIKRLIAYAIKGNQLKNKKRKKKVSNNKQA